jgi:hypothetical protein
VSDVITGISSRIGSLFHAYARVEGSSTEYILAALEVENETEEEISP